MKQASTYTAIADRLDKFKELANLICLSQMIPGIKDKDVAFMVLIECEMTGQTIFEWDQENHIICGRPSMKYDAMIAAFNSLPGCRCKLVEKSPERAALLLIDGDDEQEFSLTWQDAQREPWVYEGKESDNVKILSEGKTPPRMKAKYATPRSRAIMLFARCASDAIRTTRPEVTKGRYTPEEVEDFGIVDATSVKEVEPREPHKIGPPRSPAANATDDKPIAPPAETDETTLSDSQGEPTPESAAGKFQLSEDDPITAEQDAEVKKILRQFILDGHPEVKDRVVRKLKDSGIDGLAGLSIAEADSLIRALQNKQIETWVEQMLKGHSAVPA
jgi:hypothetical protein